MTSHAFQSDEAWLAEALDGLTTEIVSLSPSEWAEKKRYLPQSVTPLPGYYRFDVAPYLREPLDCLDPSSPVREVAFMKGVQICFTVGVLENAIGYLIDHVKTAPVMLLTADAELAKLRMESYITPMIQFSGLEHLIKSADETNTRKTGKTDKKLEWYGGGFLIPLGAVNPNKMRSFSVRYALRDEIDAMADTVGKDGDPLKLSADRCAAFEESRKIFDGSTPTIKGQSKIEKRFLRGDQRRYFVRCLKCHASQTLRWRREDKETGQVSGIDWKTDETTGVLIPGSVRYLCRECGHPHTNDDKTKLLDPAHGAEWKPTAIAQEPNYRSYHLSALYSPVGMQTWESCVAKWLDAWDVRRGAPKDFGHLQVFYNNVLGEPFVLTGERVRFEAVSAHRRHAYHFGQIPNKWTEQHCGGPVLILTCAVDVHKDNLAVAVFGWCRNRRAVLVDYWRFEGDTEQLDNPTTWGRLRELIESKEYVADDGKKYSVQIALVDSGYRTDTVYRFCEDYEYSVFPVKGREASVTGAAREFSEFETELGNRAYTITVDFYKERWHAALRRTSWDGMGLQPEGHFNAPLDVRDDQLKELTVEQRKEKVRAGTRERIGWEWVRPSGAANELWDLLVYNNAALDLMAWDVCRNQLEMESVNMTAFYDIATEQRLYFRE